MLIRTTFTIDEQTLAAMKKITVVNWSAIVREFLAEKVKEFEKDGEVRHKLPARK